MASLKVLAARSVAARVTSEESLKKLEVPASLLRDLLVAHRDSWLAEREVVKKNHSIPVHSHYENPAYKRLFPQHTADSAPRIQMSDISVSQQQVYRLFAREVGSMVRAKYPNITKTRFNQILGRIWTEMPEQEREEYEARADCLAELQLGGRV